jgi:hypothetical protein
LVVRTCVETENTIHFFFRCYKNDATFLDSLAFFLNFFETIDDVGVSLIIGQGVTQPIGDSKICTSSSSLVYFVAFVGDYVIACPLSSCSIAFFVSPFLSHASTCLT